MDKTSLNILYINDGFLYIIMRIMFQLFQERLQQFLENLWNICFDNEESM